MGQRSNSDEFRKNKKRESSSKINFLEKTTIISNRRNNELTLDDESFKLESTPNKNTEKKCPC